MIQINIKQLVAYLFAFILTTSIIVHIVVVDLKLTDHHHCTDSTHFNCDGLCECGGMECDN